MDIQNIIENRMFLVNTISYYSCHGLSLSLQKVETYLTKEPMKYLSIAASRLPLRAC